MRNEPEGEEGESGFLIENPVRDLLNREINFDENILGNRWLERRTFGVIVGPSGIGKSMVAIQMAIQAAAGLPVFGMATAHPLRAVIVQSEDSKNDRITQVECIRKIADSEELLKRVEDNCNIFTTGFQGEVLFEALTKQFSDPPTGKSLVDLFIFNPAFAFLKGSASSDEAVKSFLRFELTPFLKKMRAGAIVVHHVPKPPRRGTAKRSASTSMYSPHGSAEWTNAPRGVITIEPTNSTTVFEFTIGKRGSNSGWEADEEGYYVRYFSWAAPKSVPMMWHPATEEEIAAATAENPVTDSEITDLFTAKTPDLSRSQIVAGLSANGFVIAEHRIEDLHSRLVSKGKLAHGRQQTGKLFIVLPARLRKRQRKRNSWKKYSIFCIRREPLG